MKKTTPETVTHICDACGKESERAFDVQLTVAIKGRDFSGHVVGGQTLVRDLCIYCVGKFNKFMENPNRG